MKADERGRAGDRRSPEGSWGTAGTTRAELVDVALGRRPPDLVIAGAAVVDVHRACIVQRDVAVLGDRIARVGDLSGVIGEATRVVDASGLVLVPGLVTPHFHQWHSNHNPTVVAQCLLEQGTTTFADGFYGPAIVGGLPAVRLLADEFLRTPLKLILLAPTHAYVQNRLGGFPPAPRSPSVDDLLTMLEWPQCRGLEETFYDALCDPDVRDPGLERVVARALELGKVTTGHGVGPSTAAHFAAWAAAGIANDHEAVTAGEVELRLDAGLQVLLRHGPGFESLPATLPAFHEPGYPIDAFALCNDIAWPDTLFERGFDETVREAMRAGVDPVDAIRLATLFPARFFRVDHDVGAVLPGRLADLVLLSDLPHFAIHSVYADGQPVVEAGETVMRLEPPPRPAWAVETMNVPDAPGTDRLRVRASRRESEVTARVIGLRDGAYLSEELHERVRVDDGALVPAPADGLNLVALLERLDGSGDVGVGLVRGFGLARGAMASASNPLTQAVVAVAADAESLAIALRAVVERQGAFVAVDDGRVVAELATPLFGQTSDLRYDEARVAVQELLSAWRRLGCKLAHPFAQLEFVAATSEPRLRISTQGLVSAEPLGQPRVRHVSVIVEEEWSDLEQEATS
jgi:adenine deaminase